MKILLLSILLLTVQTFFAQTIHTLQRTESGGTYQPNGGGQVLNWKPGDTVNIPSGNWDIIDVGNFNGTPEKPIVFRDWGGKVTVKALRIGNKQITTCVKILGNLSTTYGIRVIGNLSGGFVQNFEVQGCEISNPAGVGIFVKVTPLSDNLLSQYPNFVIKNIKIKYNYLHGIEGEGMYIGHTYPKGDPYSSNLIPVRLENVEISYNILDTCGWDGIQLATSRGYNSIHHNIVKNYGKNNMGGQQAGIILGGCVNGDVTDNIVINGTGNGIEAFGYGVIKITGNTLENAGKDGTLLGQESIYCADYITGPEIDPKQTMIITGNIIKNPPAKGAIRVTGYNNNSFPATVSDNQICLPLVVVNWLSLYIIASPTGSTVINNILCGGTIPPPVPQTPVEQIKKIIIKTS